MQLTGHAVGFVGRCGQSLRARRLMRIVIPPMQVRMPFLKTHVPELASLPEPRRQEVLARCVSDPSMQALAKRHMTLMRLGWAVLPVVLIAYLVLLRTAADARIIGVVLIGGMVTAIAVMVGSVLVYHRRWSRQLRTLVQAAVATEG
jgi:hypothetical protein